MDLKFNIGWACVFSFLTALVTILFFIWASAAWGYWRLSSTTLGKVESFSVKQLKENAYGIEASYIYAVSGKPYQGKKILTNPVFLNAYAAQSHLEKYWKAQDWPVWYSAKQPEISGLQKLFPVKKFLSFALSLGVLLYFVWLKKYVEKQSA